MAINTVTAAALSTLIGEYGPDYFQVGINNANPLIKSGLLKKEDPDGDEYIAVLYPGANHATSVTLDGARLPQGGSGSPLKARAMPGVVVSVLSQGRAAAKMKLSDDRRTKMLDAELKERAADCGRIINRAIIGGSITPFTANAWSSTAANGTLIADFVDVSLFREGMAVDYVKTADKSYVIRVQSVVFQAVSSASGNIAGRVTFINDVPHPDGVTGVVPLTATATATTDIFGIRGGYPGFGGTTSLSGALFNSFDTMSGSAANAVASFMGQDPATMGIGYNWRANYLSLAAVYSQEAMLAFAARIGTVSDMAPDVAFCHPQTAAAHRASGDFHGAAFGVSAGLSAQRPMNLDKTIDKFGGSYKGSGLQVAGAEIVEDPSCQPGRVVFFNSEMTKLCVWAEIGPDEEGGDPVLLGRAYYTTEVQFSGLYNLVTDKRSTVGVVDGITNL